MLAIFEGLEDLLKKVSDISECSRALVTLASAVGILVVVFYAIYYTFGLIRLLRLYAFSQCCCQTNFVKKYGQWAVVSGSTDGIGQSMAKEFARRGMSILVVARNEDKLAKTKAMLEQIPNVGEVETVKIDLSDPSIENFERARDQIDPDNRDIGILVNNAGAFPERYARFNRFDQQEIITLVNLNVLGTVHLTRMIMPGMLMRGKGMVVNVSSILGQIPGPYFNVYAATKAFVNSFTEQLQMEYSRHPLDIILVQPGPVCTKLLKATSKLSNPSFIMPTPDDFARSTVNGLSTRIQDFTGYFWHESLACQSKMAYKLGLLHPVMRFAAYMNGANYSLSPVAKRKKVLVVSAQEAGPASSDATSGNLAEMSSGSVAK